MLLHNIKVGIFIDGSWMIIKPCADNNKWSETNKINTASKLNVAGVIAITFYIDNKL